MSKVEGVFLDGAERVRLRPLARGRCATSLLSWMAQVHGMWLIRTSHLIIFFKIGSTFTIGSTPFHYTAQRFQFGDVTCLLKSAILPERTPSGWSITATIENLEHWVTLRLFRHDIEKDMKKDVARNFMWTIIKMLRFNSEKLWIWPDKPWPIFGSVFQKFLKNHEKLLILIIWGFFPLINPIKTTEKQTPIIFIDFHEIFRFFDIRYIFPLLPHHLGKNPLKMKRKTTVCWKGVP